MRSKKRKQQAVISFTLEDSIRRDLVFLSNPVLTQGLALTPVIAAASSLKSAVILAVMAFLLIVPTRFVGELTIGMVPKNLRLMLYAIVAAIFYIPAIAGVTYLFGSDVGFYGGNFVPLLIADEVVISRAEIPVKEGAGGSLRNGFWTAVGTAVVLLITGLIREVLSVGKIWGVSLVSTPPLAIAGTAAGGFILVALLAAAQRWGTAAFKRLRRSGEDEQ